MRTYETAAAVPGIEHVHQYDKRSSEQLKLAMSYLDAHELPPSSERYVYILWILIAGIVVMLGFEYMLSLSQRTFLGAVWSKWATMQYIPRPVHRVAFFALQIRHVLFAILLFLPVLLLTFVGPDYIDPSVSVFGSYKHVDVQWGLGTHERVMTSKPTTTLPYHTFWTVGSRFGDFCNALTPLVILFALKQAPFALLYLPVFGHFASNTLQFLHKWGGYLLWIYALLHTLLWIVQVARDARVQPDMWTLVLNVPRFRWAICAFIFLTLLIVLSIPPIRRYHYECFYITHLVCVIGFMVATWAHHPQLGGWMLAGFLVWGLERAWRLVRVLYFNYSERPKELKRSMQSYEKASASRSTVNLITPTPKSEGNLGEEPDSYFSLNIGSSTSLPPTTPREPFREAVAPDLQEQLYPGFAFVQPLAGHMMRVVLRTAKPMSWKPGQWLYVNFPQMSWIQTHPFTIACSSSHEWERMRDTLDGTSFRGTRSADPLIVLLIRVRNGLTRRIWNHVEARCRGQFALANEAGSSAHSVFPNVYGAAVKTHVQGVYMRTLVDGPFGGTSRIDWGAYATCVIVCGGSGVTFGLSILEDLCGKIALIRQGHKVTSMWGRPFHTRRIRFVWIMRDYAHLQWAASALRLCLEMLPPENLTIEMYATRVHPPSAITKQTPSHDALAPQMSIPEDESDMDVTQQERPEQALHDMGLQAADLTQFEEDEDQPLNAQELSMNEQIRRQGQLLRARTRTRRSTERNDAVWSIRPMPLTVQHVNRQADEELRIMRERAHLQNKQVDVPSRSSPSVTFAMDVGGDAGTSSIASVSKVDDEEGIESYSLMPMGQDVKSPPPIDLSVHTKDKYMNIDPFELQDFAVLSELTRAGYPRLSDIVGEEMRSAEGRTIAAGCGPAGLMALLRTAVSEHLELHKAWSGDVSGHANVFTESYET